MYKYEDSLDVGIACDAIWTSHPLRSRRVFGVTVCRHDFLLYACALILSQNTGFDAGVPSLGREHHGLWTTLSLMGRLATSGLLPQRLVVRVAPAFRVISGPRLRVCFLGVCVATQILRCQPLCGTVMGH